MRLSKGGAREIAQRTEVTGFSSLTTAFQDGRGAVVASGHIGNWEVAGAAVASRGIQTDVVARGQRNRLFDEDINGTRRNFGLRVVPQSSATKGILRALRQGRVAGLVSDQDAGANGLFVDFFGWPASTARGPALFAVRTGAPLYLGLFVREPGFPQRYVGTFELIETERTGDRDADVEALVAAYTRKLEEAVRRHPEQYFWYHRRWKTRPSGGAVAAGGTREPPHPADVLDTGPRVPHPGPGSDGPVGSGDSTDVSAGRDGGVT